MNSTLLKKWIDALRSGEYSQGQRALHRNGGYCCLGVLCDISGIGEWEERIPGSFYYRTPNGGEAGSFLPNVVQHYVGLPNDDGGRISKEVLSRNLPPAYAHLVDNEVSLACLNDNGVPFNVIADIIEDQYGENH